MRASTYKTPGTARQVVEYNFSSGEITRHRPHGLGSVSALTDETKRECRRIHEGILWRRRLNPFAEIYGRAFNWTGLSINWTLSDVDDDLREMRLATMLEF